MFHVKHIKKGVISIKQDNIHYNLDNIDKQGALFNLILGEKSGGKSYQVKHKKAIEHYIKTGKKFILLRRWKDEIKTDKIEQYFNDVDVEKLTNGTYNCITYWRGGIYFALFDNEKFKTIKGEKIGYAIALSQEQNYSSVSFLDVDNIIYEEFMSRTMYIAREPEKLMIFYDTVDRKRGHVRLWLVGNTISRICPFLPAWDLQETITRMKQGDIEVKDIENSNNKIKLAIEYCRQTNQKSFAIGDSETMISGGNWLASPQPHLTDSIKTYKVVLRVVFIYQSFKFLGTLYSKKDSLVWFICPKKGDVKKNTLVFGVIAESPLYNNDIYNIDFRINNKVRQLISNSFKESNIFYSTDLCGTDFKQAIDFSIKR